VRPARRRANRANKNGADVRQRLEAFGVAVRLEVSVEHVVALARNRGDGTNREQPTSRPRSTSASPVGSPAETARYVSPKTLNDTCTDAEMTPSSKKAVYGLRGLPIPAIVAPAGGRKQPAQVPLEDRLRVTNRLAR